jgi:hypothetical protein
MPLTGWQEPVCSRLLNNKAAGRARSYRVGNPLGSDHRVSHRSDENFDPKPAGLSQRGQRLSSILIPPVMGAIADRFATSQNFMVYAAFILSLCGLLALINRRLQRPGNGDT